MMHACCIGPTIFTCTISWVISVLTMHFMDSIRSAWNKQPQHLASNMALNNDKCRLSHPETAKGVFR